MVVLQPVPVRHLFGLLAGKGKSSLTDVQSDDASCAQPGNAGGKFSAAAASIGHDLIGEKFSGVDAVAGETLDNEFVGFVEIDIV